MTFVKETREIALTDDEMHGAPLENGTRHGEKIIKRVSNCTLTSDDKHFLLGCMQQIQRTKELAKTYHEVIVSESAMAIPNDGN